MELGFREGFQDALVVGRQLPRTTERQERFRVSSQALQGDAPSRRQACGLWGWDGTVA